ncbi:uncharacterized protein [Panulirus ornatus]|uniref:uncharacterized protein n=1 Tax=Panulirus ornatus TaxID=150431 RepID=UPI003A86F237
MKGTLALVFIALLGTTHGLLGDGSAHGDEERFLAQKQTTTILRVTTSTTTVPLTCALTVSSNVCSAKRRRRVATITKLNPEALGDTLSLSGSVDEELRREARPAAGGIFDVVDGIKAPGPQPHLALKIWSSVYSTFTVTTTTTDSSTTFSLFFMCSVAGATLPPAC